MQDPIAWYVSRGWHIVLLRTTDNNVGSGESGKSTIVKQMKIIHQNGYSVDELALYRLTIYKNLIDCAKAFVGAMRQFEIEPKNSINVDYCDYLFEYQVDPDPHTPLNPKVGKAVISVWNDPSKETLMERQSEFYLMDSAP
jgi:guanine nucleotide-binding protein G(i) subunit alpha